MRGVEPPNRIDPLTHAFSGSRTPEIPPGTDPFALTYPAQPTQTDCPCSGSKRSTSYSW